MKNRVFLVSLEILNYIHLNLIDFFVSVTSLTVFLFVKELQGLVFLSPTLTPFVWLPLYSHIKASAILASLCSMVEVGIGWHTKVSVCHLAL